MPSSIAHALIRNVSLTATNDHLELRDVRVEDGWIALRGAGTRVTDAHVATGSVHPQFGAGLTLRGSDIHVIRCEITGSNRVGILVEAGEAIRINECNIVQNAAAGLENQSAHPVDARDNWWGDAAGPHGPDGDGVQGDVVFEPWRVEPVRSVDQSAGVVCSEYRTRAGSAQAPGWARLAAGSPVWLTIAPRGSTRLA